MNWLMYIGGGWVWLIGGLVVAGHVLMPGFTEDLAFLNSLTFAWISIWIWICWRFISR